MPFGVAGRAEPHPGLHWDALTLVVGAIAIVVVFGAIVAVAAWRTARPGWSADRVRTRPSVVTRSLEAVGLAPPVTIGVGMALRPGRGRTAVPVRSSLVGAAVAVLGVAAVAVFAASLEWHGRDTEGLRCQLALRRRRHARWNVPGAKDGILCGPGTTRWTDYRTVEAAAIICSVSITLDGRAVGGLGFTPLRGHIQPTVLEGRAPDGPDEVAVGSETLDALGVEIGDRVTGQSPVGKVQYRVVGRVVIPSVVDPEAVADGAVFTGAGLVRLETPNNLSASVAPVVRFRPGVDVARAAAADRPAPGRRSPGKSRPDPATRAARGRAGPTGRSRPVRARGVPDDPRRASRSGTCSSRACSGGSVTSPS